MACISVLPIAAQNSSTADLGKDAVLLSQTSDGKVVTSTYKVKGEVPQQTKFTMHFAINSATLSPTFADNAAQEAALKAFAPKLKDTMLHLQSVAVAGYASPDGNESANKALAGKRAATVKGYLANQWPSLNVTHSAHACTWKDAMSAVEQSSVPEKGEVLRILAMNVTEAQKEMHLRKLPAAWKYLKTNILPMMRRAEVTFTYLMDSIVEKKSTVTPPPAPAPAQVQPTPTPAPTPAPAPVPVAVVEEEETGIIIDMTDTESRRESRRERKAAKQKR
ncbi:MAG: OmpA family protein [Alistipes sp.]|nr:OmpA family protein [Alistipes sp.]